MKDCVHLAGLFPAPPPNQFHQERSLEFCVCDGNGGGGGREGEKKGTATNSKQSVSRFRRKIFPPPSSSSHIEEPVSCLLNQGREKKKTCTILWRKKKDSKDSIFQNTPWCTCMHTFRYSQSSWSCFLSTEASQSTRDKKWSPLTMILFPKKCCLNVFFFAW